MARLSKNQERALAKMRDAAASGLHPLPLARRFMSALSLAIPFDGYRFFQIDPQTLLISRLLDASENDRDPRGEWLGEVYFRSGDLTYIELPEQMRAAYIARSARSPGSFVQVDACNACVGDAGHTLRAFSRASQSDWRNLVRHISTQRPWVAVLQAYRREDSLRFGGPTSISCA
ncbi:MAG: hypothetical protein R2845_15945 [Thermomicrobiales bacterium]